MVTVKRVRVTEGELDEYGDPVETEGLELIPGAFLGSPSTADVSAVGRDGVTVSYRLYMPHGFDLDRHDEIDVDGERFRIVGEIIRRESPWGSWKPGQWCLIGRGEG